MNERAVARARRLIRGRQYVLDSDWGEVQPGAEDENAFLGSHTWSEYAEWHLGLTEGASEETKARHAFVYGDFRRLHRTGLIACPYRAAEWLQRLTASITPGLMPAHAGERTRIAKGLPGVGHVVAQRRQGHGSCDSA